MVEVRPSRWSRLAGLELAGLELAGIGLELAGLELAGIGLELAGLEPAGSSLELAGIGLAGIGLELAGSGLAGIGLELADHLTQTGARCRAPVAHLRDIRVRILGCAVLQSLDIGSHAVVELALWHMTGGKHVRDSAAGRDDAVEGYSAVSAVDVVGADAGDILAGIVARPYRPAGRIGEP